MPNFHYIGLDSEGKKQDGILQAITLEDAGRDVKKLGLRVLEVKPAANTRKKFKISEINLTPPKASEAAIVMFFRQLSTMLNAGIQLVNALSILSEQSKDKVLQNALKDITELVRMGLAFSEALKQHKNVFSPMVISMVRAAEAGGGLEKILAQISTFIEKDAKTRKKIKSAISYPKFVLGFFSIILLGIVFGLLPKFKDIFDGLGAELPTPTLIIMGVADFLTHNIILIAILGAGLFVGFKFFRKSEKGRLFIDQHMFGLPIAGDLVQQSAMTRFSETMGVLLNSGVGLIDSLKIASETTNNAYIDKVVAQMADQVSQGKSLGAQFLRYPDIFPTLEANMIAIGEQSGSLATMLAKVAQFNDEEFSTKVDKLSSMLEPIMMGGLGVVAAILVLGLYLPIFQMSSNIH
ncbi:MAG: type II secretion system F family protein [Candidatus Marinimicrobia bacterium]|nr:type II secretion system F family protein [Candidatus Neomarinimicrobiota bacterium]MCF7840723.1 type II secretion system F family protein [Candidatus Neomarinimicrobiota bacterium]MCF7902308.1 type II secretion system F family protein [Candidatus Neomarinimicrobiota bacterium]